MIFKNLLRIMLSLVLIATSSVAYAQDGENDQTTDPQPTEAKEVKLANGAGTISWANFVKAINNPTSVKGSVPETDPSVVAWKAAQTDSIDAEKALGAAKTALEPFATETKNAKKDYDDAEAQLATWNSQMTEYNNTLTTLTGEATELAAEIEEAKIKLDQAQADYDAVGTTTTTPIITIEPWLDEVYKKAQAYQAAYNAYIKKPSNNASITIWYILQSIGKNRYALYLSFDQPDVVPESAQDESSEEPVTWKSTTTMSAFENVMWPDGNNSLNITIVEVYLGKNKEGQYNYPVDKDPNATYEGLYTITSSFNDVDLIFNSVVNDLKSLTQTSGYYTTTNKTETTYNDPDNKLLNALNAAKKAWNDLRTKRNGVTSKMAEVRGSMTTTQGKIDGYTKVPEGAAEGALSQQAQLKKDWDDAVEKQKPYDEAVATAEANLATAKSKAAAALAAIDQAKSANGIQNYKDVTLVSDITVTEPIIATYEGTIDGGNFIITNNIPSNAERTTIFNRFTGSLYSAAINGTFAGSTSGASFDNVAYNAGATFRFYDESGAQKLPETSSFAELGFAARNLFGVNWEEGKLVKLDATTKVYDITVYETPTTSTQYYVTKNGTTLTDSKNETVTTIKENIFTESATSDLDGIDNVYYKSGANYVSKNIKITDKENFYCPAEIKINAGSYTRALKASYNAVCLPFELTADMSESIAYICEYDSEEGGKFWFTSVEGAIAPNTPALLVGKGGVEPFTLNIAGKTLMPTPPAQKVEGGTGNDNSRSYGTFKKMGRDEILGASQGYRIYGLTGEKFQAAGDKASFPAFRMAIASANVSREGEAAPRRIGIRDEQGREITIGGGESAIEDVEAAASGLSIKGGVGELIITSEANYGKVDVYALDGRLAAVANVTEGTTSVSLQSGLYIVMGKKVIVK